MGVFSINESHFGIGGIEVGMNEDYTTSTDMCIALYEAKENEYAVLEAGIKQDVVAAMCEDYDERLAINEATASGVLGKVKEILTKLLEKIKSIFHSFMAKINSFFMDSDKFFKQYSTDIAKKDFKDFEIKARKFYPDRVASILDVGVKSFTTGFTAEYAKSNDTARSDLLDSDKLGNIAKGMVFEANFASKIDDDLGNVAEEIEEYIFEDPETHDELRSTDILTSDWIGGLLNKKKFISDIEKTNKSVERNIEKLITQIGKDITGFAKTMGKDKSERYTGRTHTLTTATDGNKSSYEYADAADDTTVSGKEFYKTSRNKGAKDDAEANKDKADAVSYSAYQQALASKFQELTIKANNARLSCAKKGMAQARKIFAAAVAYNPKKEDYDLYTAVGESAEFEAIMAME